MPLLGHRRNESCWAHISLHGYANRKWNHVVFTIASVCRWVKSSGRMCYTCITASFTWKLPLPTISVISRHTVKLVPHLQGWQMPSASWFLLVSATYSCVVPITPSILQICLPVRSHSSLGADQYHKDLCSESRERMFQSFSLSFARRFVTGLETWLFALSCSTSGRAPVMKRRCFHHTAECRRFTRNFW